MNVTTKPFELPNFNQKPPIIPKYQKYKPEIPRTVPKYEFNKKYLAKASAEEYTQVRRQLQTPNRNQAEEPSKFIWLNGWLNWGSLSQRVVVSRIPSNCPFSKTNMYIGLRNTMPFLFEKSEINARIPRTFEVRMEGDMKNFQKHYRITACICLLKKFVSMSPNIAASPEGVVPLESVDFAVRRAIELLQLAQHDDLDEWNFSIVKDSEWDNFLLRFYDLAHYDARIQASENFDITKMNSTCKKILENIYRVYPEMKYEGLKNLWICKPANGSCGRGVRVLRRLADIEQYCKAECSYVIQKYIEMPLLIYNTKFDIRQWFVITSVSPLIIWMYDECYLRFCSQEFCLSNLHESVHLCNNTIQGKYKNGVRSAKLPNDNMWDNTEFSDFLKKELKQDQWPQIQDQMKQAIIAVCIAIQDRMFHRSNSFQLYGADFMMTPDFKVWLIEVNGQPAMKYSTKVTARLCKSVLEDTVKVGLLRKTDPSMKVGKFREIYHQTSEHPKTVLPSTGLVHAKKSSMLPNSHSNHIVDVDNHTKGINPKPRKITYENLAIYKTHPKVQIKQKVKTEKPLYPGDATQSNVEENVILNANVGAPENKASEKPDEGVKKIENNKNNSNTKKDGKRVLLKKNITVKKYIPNKNVINLKSKINLNSTRITNPEKNIINSNPKTLSEKNTVNNVIQSEIPKVILESTKKAISSIKLISNVLMEDYEGDIPSIISITNDSEESRIKTENCKDGKPAKLCSTDNEIPTDVLMNLDSARKHHRKNINQLFENSSEMINLLEETDSQLSLCPYDQEFDGEIHHLDNEENIVEETLVENSSIDDLFTHDIITGKELLPELSGYAFIGESCDDRKLECILNSSTFLSCIGKTDEKIRPIFKSYIDCYEG